MTLDERILINAKARESVAGANSREPALPAWVAGWFDDAKVIARKSAGPLHVERRDDGGGLFSLVSARVSGAAAMTPSALEGSTAEAYAAIAASLGKSEARHPVRLWNFIPGIHEPAGIGAHGERLDRYMVFNAGRFKACGTWFGGRQMFDVAVPTATGVGHSGSDLIIHALGAIKPGRAVGNPRQVDPFHYSRRFGPLPPCFARATVLGESRPMILIGGTASIRGEDSVYIGDIAGQLNETFENLACLVAAARDVDDEPAEKTLARFTEVRAYYMREQDLADIERGIRRAFAGSARIEFVRAALCRGELLLEIEGVAKV